MIDVEESEELTYASIGGIILSMLFMHWEYLLYSGELVISFSWM